jgi:hypothetical protein
MDYMFEDCTSLINPPNTTDWNVGNVTNMEGMFYGCLNMTSAPDTSNWDVSNVGVFWSMFQDCNAMLTPPDTSNWNTGSATDMDSMFENCSVMTPAPDVSGWDVDDVQYFDEMFSGCFAMTGLDIAGWRPLSGSGPNFCNGVTTPFSTAKYDEVLIAWSGLAGINTGGDWHFSNVQYSAGAATTARNTLTTTYSLNITDGGQA